MRFLVKEKRPDPDQRYLDLGSMLGTECRRLCWFAGGSGGAAV